MSLLCKRLWKNPEYATTAENLYDQFIAYCKNQAPDQALRKVILGGEDDSYFWSTVLHPKPVKVEPKTPGQRRLKSAMLFFEKKLEDVSDEDLARYADEIQTRILLLTYQVGSDLEAGLVFETINDRGKPLSQLDKLKNYLMYLASKTSSENLSASINACWGDLLRNIAQVDPQRDDTEEEENRFVRYHWIMETGDHREYQIHRAVKDNYRLAQEGVADQAVQYVRGLAEASELYLKVVHPDMRALSQDVSRSLSEEIKYYLLCLNRLYTVANFAPLLMAGLRRFANQPAAFKELARLCYLLAWRAYRVCGRRTDAGIGELSSLAHRVAQGKGVPDYVNELRELIELYANDSLFKNSLEQNILSSFEQKFLLYEWELCLSREMRQPTVSWEELGSLQIEHIWPREPEGYASWPETLQEKHKALVNQVGNLSLIAAPWNPQLSNRPLFEKEKKYSESNLAILRTLSQDADFSKVCTLQRSGAKLDDVLATVEEFVKRRRACLIEFALDRWKV